MKLPQGSRSPLIAELVDQRDTFNGGRKVSDDGIRRDLGHTYLTLGLEVQSTTGHLPDIHTDVSAAAAVVSRTIRLSFRSRKIEPKMCLHTKSVHYHWTTKPAHKYTIKMLIYTKYIWFVPKINSRFEIADQNLKTQHLSSAKIIYIFVYF
ncbi:hypothetical protein YC2023_114369 [Brassica napus]